MLSIFNDKEFQSLDYGERQTIATNYFNSKLADDEFRQLDEKEQTKILDNYLKSNIGEPKRTWGEAISDTAMSFGKGSGGLVKNIGDLGQLISEGNEATAQTEAGMWGVDLPNQEPKKHEPNALQKLGEETQDFYDKRLSTSYKAQLSQQQKAIDAEQNEGMKFWRTIETTATNPALFVGAMTEQLPQIVAGGVAGRAVGLGATALGASAKLAGGLATGASVGTEMALQGSDVGADTFNNLMKLDDNIWAQNKDFQALVSQGAKPEQAKHDIALNLARKAGGLSALLTGATNALPSMRASERMMSGSMHGGQGMLKGGAKSFVGEGLGEAVEEGGGQLSSNYFQQNVNPNQSLTEGVGQSAGQGFILGAPMGGVSGAIEGGRPKTMTELVQAELAKDGDVGAVSNAFNIFDGVDKKSDSIAQNLSNPLIENEAQNDTTSPTIDSTTSVPSTENTAKEAQENTIAPKVKENLTDADSKISQKVKDNLHKFKNESDFVSVASKVGGKTSSEILSYIDSNTKGNLDFDELRKNIGESSYFKDKVNIKDLKIENEEHAKSDNKDQQIDLSKPIVVDKNGNVIDGRHRATYAKEQGITQLNAYVPAETFYKNNYKLAKATEMEKVAMQNGDIETAKKISEAKTDLELKDLQAHPRYQELLDMRKDISAKDTQYSQKLATPRDIRTVNNGKGNEIEVTGAVYEPNYASDFELTKADVKALQSGKATPKTIQKLKNDLGRLDNDPQWKLDEDEQQARDNMLFSKAEEKDLIVQHNLSSDNLDYALKNGGMSVPSLAITKKGTPLTGFGEISLIGDKNLADPKGKSKTKVFGADIYSPRHPREEKEYKSSDIRKMDKELEKYSIMLRDGSLSSDRDIADLSDNRAMQMKFLEEQKGIKIDIPKTKNSNEESISKFYPDEYKYSLANKGIDWISLYKNENFRKKVFNDLKEKFKERGKDLNPIEAYGEDGFSNIARERAQSIDLIGRNQNKPDMYAMRDLLRKEIEQHREEYLDYVNKFTEPYSHKSYFYADGKKKKYDQDTVLKYLTSNLRGGENFNYGAGNVRAMVTPEFKSIEEIKKAKNRLVTNKEFEAIKDSLSSELLDIAHSIASKGGNQFIATDNATQFIQDYAKRGRRAINDYDVNVNAESLKRIDEFLNKLKEAPTEYFEGKITRQVQPSEFHTAVVPDNASRKTIDALKKQGLNIKTYKSGDEADRARAIKEASEENDLAFSKGKGSGTSVEKAQAIVRKVLGNSKASKDVEVVQSFDSLPSDLIKRMELMSVAYHGTPHKVDKFSTKYIGTGEGAQAYGYGLYFADSKEVAEFYRNKLSPNTSLNDLNSKLEYITLGDKKLSDFDIDPYDVVSYAEKSDTKGFREYASSKVKSWDDLSKDGEYRFPEYAKEKADAWRKVLETKGELRDTSKGNLYKVDLKPQEHEYLLWDKPLSEHSDYIKEKLGLENSKADNDFSQYNHKMIEKYGYITSAVRGMTTEEKALWRELKSKASPDLMHNGQSLYNKLTEELGSDKLASEKLNSMGIKGIKYADGNSRGKSTEQQYNYVIFNDEDVSVPELLQSTDGTVRGVFDPSTNKAYLVADTMKKNEVKGVLLHELLHRYINKLVADKVKMYGTQFTRAQAIMGSRLSGLVTDLNELIKLGDKDAIKAMKSVTEANTPKQHRTEEMLAYLLQNYSDKYSTPLKEFIAKVVKAFKDFARRVATKMGINTEWFSSQYTADDIAEILKSYALEEDTTATNDAPLMSKTSDRLMEWHKDSAPETKNADGTPKVFYHGTDKSFEVFDNTKSNNRRVDTNSIFLTDDKSVAREYGDKVVEAYTKMETPTVFDFDGKSTVYFDGKWRTPSELSNRIEEINQDLKKSYVLDEDLKADLEDAGWSDSYADKIDGIVMKNINDNATIGSNKTANHYVVFNSSQIKSVNNSGTFDESNPNIFMSKKETVEKIRNSSKQFISDQIKKKAIERSVEALSKPKDETYTAFKNYFVNTLPQKYMDALSSMLMSKNKITQQVGIIKTALSTLSAEQRTQLHEYIVDDTKDIAPELKELADKAKAIITDLGQKLIDAKILDGHVVKAWEGKFLRRQFEDEQAVLGTSKFKEYFFGSKKSLAKQYTRGLQIQAKTESEAMKAINGYMKAYGHDELGGMGVENAIQYLKDNGLFADGAQWKSEGKIKVRQMKNGEYEIIRDFTKAERKKMKEVTDASITIPDTILRLSNLLEHGKLLQSIDGLSNYVTDDKTIANENKWSQIPNLPQYGVLAGKYARPDIVDDVVANQNVFFERNGLVDSWLKALSVWKKSRTVWSPTGHFNNFVSNLFIKSLTGINPIDKTIQAGNMLGKLKAFEALEVKDAMGRLSAEEAVEFANMKAYLKDAIELRNAGMLGHTQLLDINRGFEQEGIEPDKKGLLGKVDDAVSRLYQGGDTIHRLSAYMLLKKEGYDSDTAMNVIDKLFPDYSKPMPKFWKFARDMGISPFISWSYYTLPSIAKLTKANTARALGAYSALMAIGYMGMLLSSDGDWEEAMEAFLNLPEDAIGRRMPIYKNDKGEVLTWKVDRMLPFMDLASPLLGMASGAVQGKQEQGGLGHIAMKGVSGALSGAGNTIRSYFAGPLVNALIFNTMGKDAYSANDIVKKDATDKQRAYLTTKYYVEQYAPLPTPLIRMYDMAEAMYKGEDERKRNATVVPRSVTENMIGLAGINVLRYDKKALEKQTKNFSAEAQDFTEIKQKLTRVDGMLKEAKERHDNEGYTKIAEKHQDELGRIKDLKNTEKQLLKLKHMREEAMMNNDDKAVLQLNEQINKTMKAFNERNKK